MTILSLDPGLTTGWALFDLQIGYHGRLTLVEYGALVGPVADGDGYAGRATLRQWLTSELLKLPAHDEACTDRDHALYATCIPATGAFAAAQAHCDDHGLCVRGKRVIAEYPRKSGVCTVEKLSGQSVRVVRTIKDVAGNEVQKAVNAVSVPKYRSAIEAIVLRPLARTQVHELDAMAIGIHHSHKAHGWRPAGWLEPRVVRRQTLTAAWLEAFKR